MIWLLMFLSNFVVVFLLGIQSKNVMHSRYIAAVVTSFGISVGQFLFTKFAATGGMLEFIVCASGGCAGIAFAIYFHDRIMRPKKSVAKSDFEGYMPLGGFKFDDSFKDKQGLL
ncbi:hypothetical protein [Methyloversatilis sp.]|uniref:hypothetical protein n=1 Tax=Methyloversatilis sp. TaxID=2569862 RepID=UPI0035B00337